MTEEVNNRKWNHQGKELGEGTRRRNLVKVPCLCRVLLFWSCIFL